MSLGSYMRGKDKSQHMIAVCAYSLVRSDNRRKRKADMSFVPFQYDPYESNKRPCRTDDSSSLGPAHARPEPSMSICTEPEALLASSMALLANCFTCAMLSRCC